MLGDLSTDVLHSPVDGGTVSAMPAKPTPISDWRKQAFLEWLCTPVPERDPSTMQGLADQLQIERRTLTNWKTQDKEFMQEWEKLYLRTVGNPERKQNLLDVLYKTGSDGDDPKHVQATKTYFELVEAVKPQKMEVAITRPAASLSDDELNELLAVRATEEQQARLKLVTDA